MPTAEEKEALITTAVEVVQSYERYVKALEANQANETAALEWPVIDILDCAAEARRRVKQPHRDEDELLTIFEALSPDIRQRYAEERAAQLEELNEQYEGTQTGRMSCGAPAEHVFDPMNVDDRNGAWDAVPNGL